MKAYCAKCKTKRRLMDDVDSFVSKRYHVIKGKCAVCGKRYIRFWKGKRSRFMIKKIESPDKFGMSEIEVQAKSIEEAIEIALKKLGARKVDVEIKILSEEAKGLFGREGAKPAKVKVKVKRRDVRG